MAIQRIQYAVQLNKSVIHVLEY